MSQDNPKLIRALKDGKVPYEYLVLDVLEGDALVHKGGADKYGIRNWTIDKIRASTYIAAILRHLFAWAAGQDLDPESGYSHLYHIRACCAILLDSESHDTLIDDRNRAESINDREVVRGRDDLEAHGPELRKFDAPITEEITGEWHRQFDSPQGLCAPAITGRWKFATQYVVGFRDARANDYVAVTYKGPFTSLPAAEDYARINPQQLVGTKSIHAIHQP